MWLHLALRVILVCLILLSAVTFGLLHVYFVKGGSDWGVREAETEGRDGGGKVGQKSRGQKTL